jgi:hypothetical protein
MQFQSVSENRAATRDQPFVQIQLTAVTSSGGTTSNRTRLTQTEWLPEHSVSRRRNDPHGQEIDPNTLKYVRTC